MGYPSFAVAVFAPAVALAYFVVVVTAPGTAAAANIVVVIVILSAVTDIAAAMTLAVSELCTQ